MGTLTFWMPLYLSQTRGWDLKQIALFAWLPFLAADFGCLFGGALSLWLQRYWGISLINARRAAFTLGAVMMLGVGFVGIVQSPYAAIALLSLAGFAHQTLSVTVITMSSDLFKKNEVATIAGMAGTSATQVCSSSRFLSARWSSRLVTHHSSLLGLFDIVGAVILWTVVKEIPVEV